MKNTKKILVLLFCMLIAATMFCGCFEEFGDITEDTPSSGTASEQGGGNDKVDKQPENKNVLGDYVVEIKSARLAKDYSGKDIVIVNFSFTNNNKDAKSFSLSVDDKIYQNGVECEKCYFVADSANYNSDNQLKSIKTGTTIDVEVAYTLNDTTTPIEVEVSELFSFDDKKITKTFDLK